MKTLKEKLHEKIEEHRPRIKRLLKEHGETVINEVTVQQVIGGMRGIKSLITDISYLDPYEGIRYRGFTLHEVFEKLPKAEGGKMPCVEGLFHLFLTGEMPTENDVADFIYDTINRRQLPKYVYEVIDGFPSQSHPISLEGSKARQVLSDSSAASNR